MLKKFCFILIRRKLKKCKKCRIERGKDIAYFSNLLIKEQINKKGHAVHPLKIILILKK